MEGFIHRVLKDLNYRSSDINNATFILPSKRAGVFLKKELASFTNKPVFAPTIYSIEEFVENLSDLKLLSDHELLFKLYNSYLKFTPKEEREPFEIFFVWAKTLMQDFNEIDRYLINQDKIFDYLKAIKELNHWSLEENQTPLILNHLKFWNRLKPIYNDFVSLLLANNEGYQGLIYREACNNLELYMENHPERIHIFMGFNALNSAEQTIIQELLANGLAQIYWDIDARFINDKQHDAGFFLRDYKTWPYFKNNNFNWTSNDYSKPKSIKCIGVPKNVGQAKYIGHLLKCIRKTNTSLNNVSVIMGEESLLTPLLNSFPEFTDSINVTMGLSLKYTPLASLFISIFDLHKNDTAKYYYKDVINLITLPSIYSLFLGKETNKATELIEYINNNNISYLDVNHIKSIISGFDDVIEIIFNSWEKNPNIALKQSKKLIFKLKQVLNPSTQKLELEYLYRFHTLFNRLNDLNESYGYLDSISSLNSLFSELLNMETMDFQGEPLEGLQVMGMLESRVLDFDTVIISSVNEGILPAGKTVNSFIPYNVKLENRLPTYKEKDAVYTYHFYRLLQRAKNIYILYNTEIDTLKGGEKSRFISQLEVEGVHHIDQIIAQPQIPVIDHINKNVPKTPSLIGEIKQLANTGFSPSSLSSYIRNPIDFYYEKILNIKEFEEVEESIASNTLGTIIHNTLETLYKPYEHQFLTEKILNSFKNKIEETVAHQFKITYKQGDYSSGKNLIIFKTAQHLISRFIGMELENIHNGNKIKILAIETDESTPIKITGIEAPIKIRGKVDRVDEFNGTIRIIDYKSGRVEKNKVVIDQWDEIASDYDKFSKPFQLMCYTYMMYKENKINLPVEAGIFSFKNLSSGLLKFGKKDPTAKTKRNELIDEDTMLAFETELKKLISEIFDPEVDFTENEI